MSVKLKKSNLTESQSITGLYLLFAHLLAEELKPEVIDVLCRPEISELFSKADSGFGKSIKQVDLEAAAADFCDLFILPGKQQCSPRAIAWLGEGNSVTADGIHALVEAFLDQTGIELPAPFSALPYDHAANLFFLAAKLYEIESPQAKEFEQTALHSWVSNLGQKLSLCEIPIYRASGRLIENYCN